MTMKREAKVKKVDKVKKRRLDKDSAQKPDAQHSKQNPKIEDATSCYLCGLAEFESQFDATVHEISCNGKQNPFGPWKCSTCGKIDFSNSSGFGSHRIICFQSAMKGTSLTLRPACMEEMRTRLSDYNVLVTESIELVEVSQDDIGRFAKSQRKRTLQVGNVGIRCVYCVANGAQPPGSMSCPQNLRSLPHNIYNMVQRHLLSSCPYIPKNVQNQLELAKKNTTSQSGQKGRIGLPLYFTRLVNEFGLTDNGKNEGMQRFIGNRDTLAST
jgi:hypothetical protein